MFFDCLAFLGLRQGEFLSGSPVGRLLGLPIPIAGCWSACLHRVVCLVRENVFVPKPTYEELADLVVALKSHLVDLEARIARQDGRIAELERQVAATSRNSSKPPSSDGLAKPNPKSLRGKSGRKPGGQSGHGGQTLAQVSDPDEVLRHEPTRCRGCGAGLGRAPEVGVARRQVFDLPPISIRVTEHELVSRRCRCGVTTTADGPAGVNAPVQYGARIKAVMVYLYMGQYLSKHRTAVAMSELFGTPVSDGSGCRRGCADAGGVDEQFAVADEAARIDRAVLGQCLDREQVVDHLCGPAPGLRVR